MNDLEAAMRSQKGTYHLQPSVGGKKTTTLGRVAGDTMSSKGSQVSTRVDRRGLCKEAFTAQ